MRATAKLTSKGQITIPAKIRERLKLRAGDSLTFVEKDGAVKVEAVRSEVSVFEKWRGIGNPAGVPSGIKAINRYMRELRGHDELD